MSLRASVDTRARSEHVPPGTLIMGTHPAHHLQPTQGLSEGDTRNSMLRSCHLPGENYCSRRTLQEWTLVGLGKRPGLEIQESAASG